MASSRTANSRAFSGCSCSLRTASATCYGSAASEPNRVKIFSFLGSLSKIVSTQPLCQATPNQSKLMLRPVNQHRNPSFANARGSDIAEDDSFEPAARVRRHGQGGILHAIHVSAYRVTSFAVKHVPARLNLITFLDLSSHCLKVRRFEHVAQRYVGSLRLGGLRGQSLNQRHSAIERLCHLDGSRDDFFRKLAAVHGYDQGGDCRRDS